MIECFDVEGEEESSGRESRGKGNKAQKAPPKQRFLFLCFPNAWNIENVRDGTRSDARSTREEEEGSNTGELVDPSTVAFSEEKILRDAFGQKYSSFAVADWEHTQSMGWTHFRLSCQRTTTRM